MAQATSTDTRFDTVLKITLLALFAFAAGIVAYGATQATDVVSAIVIAAVAVFVGWMTYLLKKEMFR